MLPEVITVKIRDSIAAKRSIFLAALRSGVSYKVCRQQMAEAIDEAWATADPEAKAYQDLLFPGGKPTPEQLRAVVGGRLQDPA